MQAVKEAYAQIQKKYSLPTYDELNQEFELFYVSPITEISFPLRFVKRRIVDRLINLGHMLQNILEPNPNSSVSLRESGFFTTEEKEQLFQLFKQIMVLERTAVYLEAENDEKADVRYIQDAYKAWTVIKKAVTPLLAKLPEGWQQEEKPVEREKESYFN